MNTVWLVLDHDRQPLDVCTNEETARALARTQNGTAEEWPLTRSERDEAWKRAVEATLPTLHDHTGRRRKSPGYKATS